MYIDKSDSPSHELILLNEEHYLIIFYVRCLWE